MPTKREREYYRMGFRDGERYAREGPAERYIEGTRIGDVFDPKPTQRKWIQDYGKKPKRKLSAWNKFVKANSKKKEFRYRDGKLNLKKMGVAFRRKKRR